MLHNHDILARCVTLQTKHGSHPDPTADPTSISVSLRPGVCRTTWVTGIMMLTELMMLMMLMMLYVPDGNEQRGLAPWPGPGLAAPQYSSVFWWSKLSQTRQTRAPPYAYKSWCVCVCVCVCVVGSSCTLSLSLSKLSPW